MKVKGLARLLDAYKDHHRFQLSHVAAQLNISESQLKQIRKDEEVKKMDLFHMLIDRLGKPFLDLYQSSYYQLNISDRKIPDEPTTNTFVREVEGVYNSSLEGKLEDIVHALKDIQANVHSINSKI